MYQQKNCNTSRKKDKQNYKSNIVKYEKQRVNKIIVLIEEKKLNKFKLRK